MERPVRYKAYEDWRIATLVGVHLLFVAHFVHWKLKGRTLAPLEFNEVLYTIHQGIVTAGFVLMAVVMVATLVFGRFFCSWGCHILALQDAAGWLMDKLRIKRQPIRSRTLVWAPIAVMFYLFIWPQLLQLWHGAGPQTMEVVAAGGSRWSSFTTDDMWRNLPPPGVAVFTFFVCGFVIVYLLGSRGFCFQACPYGALFGLADQLAPGRIVLAKDCSQCGLCTQVCSSDILVHRELAMHGMVTNPRCLKDLDCVAVCPENAVQYGFRKPPLFRKGHPMGAYGGRFSNSWREDLFLAGAFLVAMPILRGLYDRVPFLLAVALALCSAYLLLVGGRLLYRKAYQVRGVLLKMDGGLRRAGIGAAVLVVLLVGFLAHSAVVQYHTKAGRSLFQRIAVQHTGDIDGQLLDRAMGHYRSALAIGFMAPADQRQELAALYLLRGETNTAEALLQGILKEDPTHAEARYHLASIMARRGDLNAAMHQWEEALSVGRERSTGRSRELLMRSALELGTAHGMQKEPQREREAYMKGLERVPGEVPLLVALGNVESRMGLDAEAIAHLEAAVAAGGATPMLHNNLGALYLRVGAHGKALEHFRELARLRPDDAQVHYTTGVLLARIGDRERAMQHLSRAARLAPHDPRASQALAMLRGGEDRPLRSP